MVRHGSEDIGKIIIKSLSQLCEGLFLLCMREKIVEKNKKILYSIFNSGDLYFEVREIE